MASSTSESHTFKIMEFQPAEAKKFFSTVRKEMALLATSLPDGIMVKTFEDRMASSSSCALHQHAHINKRRQNIAGHSIRQLVFG